MSETKRQRAGAEGFSCRAAVLFLLVATSATAEISVTCVPERAVVDAGEPVVVRAWVTDDTQARPPVAPKFSWKTRHGVISGDEQASWTPKPDKSPSGGPTAVTASVYVDAGTLGTATCEVAVVVQQPPATPKPEPIDRSPLMAARLFLLPDTSEPENYGLRSYLIFTAPPEDEGANERSLSAIGAYLRVLVPAEDLLSRNVRTSQISLTMLPVLRADGLSDKLNSPAQTRTLAVEILQRYDYATARRLLAELGVGSVGGGPYLIARETRTSGVSQGKLLVDMSGVSPDLIREWMTWFCWLTGQERSWSEVALKRLGLNMRNIIAVTAETTPVVLTSMAQWVYVLKRR
jgi:hypothetical protein